MPKLTGSDCSRWPSRGLLALFAAGMAGCELDRTMIPEREPVLVIQSVMVPDAAAQFVVVENSQSGEAFGGAIFGGPLPSYPASNPVTGATVTLTHLDPPTGCASARVVLTEQPISSNIQFQDPRTSGIYATDRLCVLGSGDRVQLDVEAPDGRRVRGTTRIPGIRNASVTTRGSEVAPLPLARHLDTVAIAMDAQHTSAIQVDVIRSDRIDILGFDLPEVFLTDSFAIRIPGDRRLVRDGDPARPLFQPGRYYVLSVSAVDGNYYDFARSGSDIFTGKGFINHLDGGVGVFGSVRSVQRLVRVTDEQIDPREGLYRMAGTVDGEPVDVTFEPYLKIPTDVHGEDELFAAFIEGHWRGQEIQTTVDGGFAGDPFARFGRSPFSMMLFLTENGERVEYSFDGVPGDYSRPFRVEVRTATPDPVGQLLVERIE